MIGKPSASQDSSFHDDSTAAENGHGIHTPDIDDHPLRPPAAAHLHTGEKNIEHEKPAPSRPHKPHRSRRNVHDAEKVSLHRKSIPAQPIYAFPRYPQHSAYPDDLYETDDDDNDEEDGPKRHSVWILVCQPYITASPITIIQKNTLTYFLPTNRSTSPPSPPSSPSLSPSTPS